MDDVYERIKKDIAGSSASALTGFFKSRSQALQRRCNMSLGMIEKEDEARETEEAKLKAQGKKREAQKIKKKGSRPSTLLQITSEKRPSEKKKAS